MGQPDVRLTEAPVLESILKGKPLDGGITLRTDVGWLVGTKPSSEVGIGLELLVVSLVGFDERGHRAEFGVWTFLSR